MATLFLWPLHDRVLGTTTFYYGGMSKRDFLGGGDAPGWDKP